MSTRVLVPMDGSEQSWSAFEYAVEQFPEATLVCLRIVDPVEGSYGGGMGMGIDTAANDIIEAGKEAAEKMFEELREEASAAGVDVETELKIGRPSRTIVASAEAADHVVIGSHGRDGIARILLGSVAETVVRRSPVPVTVVR